MMTSHLHAGGVNPPRRIHAASAPNPAGVTLSSDNRSRTEWIGRNIQHRRPPNIPYFALACASVRITNTPVNAFASALIRQS